MDMKSIRSDVAQATCHYMGEDIVFKYRPAMVTPMTYAKLTEVRDLEELKKFICELIVWWDLTDKGKNVGVTPEVVANLPMPLLGAFTQAIMREVPEKAAGND